jgi:hypothetical protein
MLGQATLGIALGLWFTAPVIGQVLQHWIAVSLCAVWAVVLGTAFAWALHRWTEVDWPTAFFSGAVGGASEMAVQGERAGGRVDLIAAAHSVRILFVVVSIPLGFSMARGYAVQGVLSDVTGFQWEGLLLLTSSALACGASLHLARFPNCWMLGPLVSTMAITALFGAVTFVPTALTAIAQLLIGISLGSRFSERFLAAGPRFLTFVFFATVVGVGVSLVAGWLLATGFRMPPADVMLGAAPGGLAEMSLTAQSLALSVPLVVGIHLVRVLILVLLAQPLFNLTSKLRGEQIGGAGDAGVRRRED